MNIVVGNVLKSFAKLPAPSNFISIKRTENQQQLAEIYSASDVFFNPTLQDTFPTVNLEAEACGLPVVTYNTGGAKETIHLPQSKVVPKRDLEAAIQAIKELTK